MCDVAPIAAFIEQQLDVDEADGHAAMQFTTGTWDLPASCVVNLNPRAPAGALDRNAADSALTGVVTGAEREAAQAAVWDGVVTTDSDAGVARHIVRHDPVRVLREIAVHRAILTAHSGATGGQHRCPSEIVGYSVQAWHDDADPCPTIRELACIWSDRPGFDPAWGTGG